jgi:hypothetical protein
MRLQELFLVETTEEDRAIISLSKPIFSKLSDLSTITLEKGQVINAGTIGDLFDTPLNILDPVKLAIWTNEDIVDDFVPEDRRAEYLGDGVDGKKRRNIYGLWDGETNTIVFNYDFIASNSIKQVITHELRHALDDYKSDFKANTSRKYSTPKKKEHRKDYSADPYATDDQKSRPYRAQPAEINARFAEVLHGITAQAAHALKKDPDPASMRSRLLQNLKQLLRDRHISDLFPEKEQSKDYKRLIKRAVDMIDKEVAHLQPQK